MDCFCEINFFFHDLCIAQYYTDYTGLLQFWKVRENHFLHKKERSK